MSQLQPKPSYRLLEAVEDHVQDKDVDVSDVKQVIESVLPYFPELAERTITVGITHQDISWHGEPYAMADPYNDMIFIKARCLKEYQVIFHELTHILIHVENENGANHPATSEEYCSILAVSKMPSDMVYRESIAYLGKPNVSKERYPEICQRALDYREDHRNYIQKAREWLQI